MSIQIKFTSSELKAAEEFCKECLKNRQDIKILFDCGFFKFKGGQGIIDRDKDGILQGVKVNDIRYKRQRLK